MCLNTAHHPQSPLYILKVQDIAIFAMKFSVKVSFAYEICGKFLKLAQKNFQCERENTEFANRIPDILRFPLYF